MSVHVIGMAAAFALATVQFLLAGRRHSRLHAALGTAFLGALVMGGAGGLLMTATGETYGADLPTGRLVELGNAGLVLMTWVSAGSALVALRARLGEHRDWMKRCYALLATALTLRLLLIVLGRSGLDYVTSYAYASAFSVPINLLVAALIVRPAPSIVAARRSRPDGPFEPSRPSRIVRWLLGVFGLGVAAPLVVHARELVAAPMLGLGVAWAFGYALVCLSLAARAKRRGDRRASAAWWSRVRALCWLPITAYALAAAFTRPHEQLPDLVTQAFVGAIPLVMLLGEFATSRVPRVCARWAATVLADVMGLLSLLILLLCAVPAFALDLTFRLVRLRAAPRLATWPGRYVLADLRDEPVLAVLVRTLGLLVPTVLALVWLGRPHPALAALYLLVLCGPALRHSIEMFSCLHNEGHRRDGFFRVPDLRAFEWGVGILYGNVPEMVRSAHVRLHHRENGGPDDPQGSSQYDHASLRDCVRFLGRENLAFSSGVAPLLHFWRRRDWRSARRMAAGMITYALFAGALAARDIRLAGLVALVPFLLNNALTGIAAWVQHAFVDRARPNDALAGTVTLLHENDFLNEGIHLAHHYRCSEHFSELPALQEDIRGMFARRGAIVFHGLDHVQLWMLLCLRKRFDKLARHLAAPPALPPQWTPETWLRVRVRGLNPENPHDEAADLCSQAPAGMA
jgi:hypothetical protein